MTGKGQKIAVQILHIYRLVNNILAGIDQKQRPLPMCLSRHPFNRKIVPKTLDMPVTATSFVRGVSALRYSSSR